MENTVGSRIKSLAKAKGLTLSALSHACGISASAISAITNGKSSPSYDMITKIIAGFPDINPDWLLLGVGEMMREARRLQYPVLEPIPATEPSTDLLSDSACWEILKREEAQHQLLKKDYEELKGMLRQARIDLFLLQQRGGDLS